MSHSRNDKADYVQRLFTSIVGRYDFLNTLLSLNQDRRWRRFAARKSGLKPHGLALDVATGTGELALELARRIQRTGKVVGVDFCEPMLRKAREKVVKAGCEKVVDLVLARAEKLPFSNNLFDCATIGFALRNVTDLNITFQEMTRVIKPGGTIVCLELAHPSNRLFRKLYYAYLFHVAPLIGGFISRKKEEYVYLPRSLLDFPSSRRLKEMLEEEGMKQIEVYHLTLGVVAVHIGTKGGSL